MESWSFACPDWVERLAQGKTPIADLPLNAEMAARAVNIFNRLKLPDVIGQPPMETAAGEWFRDIVRAAFGSMESASGIRRVGEIFALVPKKNAKTTYAAALGVTALLMNARPNAEMLIIGPTQDVSDLCFSQAKGMVEADPEGYLQKRFHIIEHKKIIQDRLNGTKLRIKSFDTKVVTGTKPVLVILDEMHIMSKFSSASQVMRQIRGGLLPNEESLLVIITTQSDEPPAGLFKKELQYARGVRDGLITENVTMLPVIYEFSEEMQRNGAWKDPDNWPMVLPNLGLSIDLGRLKTAYGGALDRGEEDERSWASQHLNVEIGLALHTDRWAGVDYWEGAADKSLTLNEIIARCEVVTVGVDGGGLDDLFGLAVTGRCATTRDWLFWFKVWAQTDVFERRKEIAERLRDFEKQKTLTVCPATDPTMDFREATEIIVKLNNANMLPKEAAIGLDPFGVAELVDNLLEAGLTEEQMVGIAQGVKLSSAIWGMERKLKDGAMWHDGSEMMNWIVGNAKAEQRGNAIYVSKQAAGKAKIDPLVAGFNSFTLMARNPEPAGRGSMLLDMDGVLV